MCHSLWVLCGSFVVLCEIAITQSYTEKTQSFTKQSESLMYISKYCQCVIYYIFIPFIRFIINQLVVSAKL